MGKLILDISMSLDGFVTGPRPTLEKEGGLAGSPAELEPANRVPLRSGSSHLPPRALETA
jgi:hypothetical protein